MLINWFGLGATIGWLMLLSSNSLSGTKLKLCLLLVLRFWFMAGSLIVKLLLLFDAVIMSIFCLSVLMLSWLEVIVSLLG